MRRILFVCFGNIHRSPVAETCAALALASEPDVIVGSRGMFAEEGGSMALRHPTDFRRATPTLNAYGVTLLGHRSRPFMPVDAEADAIIAMDSHIHRQLWDTYPTARPRIHHFSEMNGTDEDVEDPIGGDEHVFERVISYIADTVNEQTPTLLAWARANGRRTS